MSKSSFRNSSELIDRYLHSVRFWMPKSRRQEDLIAELGEDLRSQVEDKETELGRALDAEEVSAILKRCGPPMIVAGRFAPRRQLIGPTLYPIYEFVMKMVLLWIMIPVFIFIIGPVNVASANGDLIRAALNTAGNLWSALFTAAATITLVFAVLERVHVPGVECKWDPLKLPPLPKHERKTSLIQTVCELGFGVFGLMWLLLVPHAPVLIFGPAASFLKLAPMWHLFYGPIVALAVLGIVRSGLIVAHPEWTGFPLWSQLMQTVLSLILVNFLINVAGQANGGDWHPFVMLADSVKNPQHYIRIIAVVNASVLISLASTWLGLSIAGVVQTWHLMRYLRKRLSDANVPASLSVL
jgi:hypothetical protein